MDVIGASASHLPEANALAGQWASYKIFGHPNAFEKFCSFTVMRSGSVIAVIILHNWDRRAGVIEISAAGSGPWQSRRLINDVFGTCFGALGCQMVVMRGDEKNVAMLRNSERLGFSGHFIPRLGGRDTGQWLFTMTDDDWRENRLNQSREI